MEVKIEELKNLEMFNNISESTIGKILEESDVKEHRAGEILFEDKEDVSTVYFVLKGIVSLYKINECGQKKVIFMLGKGKIINEVIIKELPASINCEIFEDAVILGIKKEKLLNIMKEDFDLCKNIIISLSSKTRRLYRQLKNTPSSIKIEKRLAAKLYKLAKDYGVEHEDGIVIDMEISITYMADLLGSQRETVSRAMKVLQKNNLINYKSKKIIISNFEKLALFFKTS
ncbi:Crp/Fnr family transcriptional regulator [Clostridium butyricum]|uniref:Crp/Fnr family transcriptional regulator n=2 Tax=Clostridium butyricum TaxID=1492 RepID=A0A2S7FDG5_CLOBU|nr:Crp/Fnr family transcriptional regulator [Clostridium butyricum]KHD13590.1 Crp/Fnr family transcriptional regulator [Clostridium butyricum]MBZ0311995.1 Crp/Fnr family transcriptional regulator [Clostridium butyricum]MDB2151378.1 Crp/Fnr family transcriptional regulator [Clostridium butyricum]MDU1006075.1 Crp/Fnr family transcriptional regulator [Clostridium butyricum]MDU1509395.1 Crp/Fnr family transcriptional regulator [Clostridium butyricum]